MQTLATKYQAKKWWTWCFPNSKSSTRKWCVALAEELHSFCRSLIWFFQNSTVFEKIVKFLSCDFHFPKQWGNIHAVLVIRSSGPVSDPQVTCGVGRGAGMSFCNIKAHPSATGPPARPYVLIFSIMVPGTGDQMFKYVSLGGLFIQTSTSLSRSPAPPPWKKASWGSHCTGHGYNKSQETSCIDNTSLSLVNLLPQLPSSVFIRLHTASSNS